MLKNWFLGCNNTNSSNSGFIGVYDTAHTFLPTCPTNSSSPKLHSSSQSSLHNSNGRKETRRNSPTRILSNYHRQFKFRWRQKLLLFIMQKKFPSEININPTRANSSWSATFHLHLQQQLRKEFPSKIAFNSTFKNSFRSEAVSMYVSGVREVFSPTSNFVAARKDSLRRFQSFALQKCWGKWNFVASRSSLPERTSGERGK